MNPVRNGVSRRDISNGVKTILFVCVENSCRSQIAQGLAEAMGHDVLEAYSAGSRPSGKINPLAIEVMKEIGIEISGQKSKGFSDLPVKKFDYVITLGCKDKCPFVPAREHVDWQIADPKDKGIDFFRITRGEIKNNVSKLIQDIKESK